MNTIVTRLALCAFALLFVRGAMAASYTDELAWRAAVSNVYAIDRFDSTPSGTEIISLPALGIEFDPLDDNTYPTVQPYSSTGGVERSGPHNLLNDSDFALPARGPYSMRAINPGDLLFGIGLWNVGGDDQLRMSFLDADDNIIEQVTSASGLGFFGIVNPLGAARVEIDFVDGNGYAPVDDLQTAVRRNFDPTVPEPSACMLAALGLGLIVAARRRRN